MKSKRALPRRQAFHGRVALIFGPIILAITLVALLVTLATQLPAVITGNLRHATASKGTNVPGASTAQQAESLPPSPPPQLVAPAVTTSYEDKESLQLNSINAPFDLTGISELSRNAIQLANDGRPPFISRPSHRANFKDDHLEFIALGTAGEAVPLAI